MATLNAASAAFYEQWDVRVNKSQVLRALVAMLRESSAGLERELERGPPPRPLKAPPKAARADVHRRFEAEIRRVLERGILAFSVAR